MRRVACRVVRRAVEPCVVLFAACTCMPCQAQGTQVQSARACWSSAVGHVRQAPGDSGPLGPSWRDAAPAVEMAFRSSALATQQQLKRGSSRGQRLGGVRQRQPTRQHPSGRQRAVSRICGRHEGWVWAECAQGSWVLARYHRAEWHVWATAPVRIRTAASGACVHGS